MPNQPSKCELCGKQVLPDVTERVVAKMKSAVPEIDDLARQMSVMFTTDQEAVEQFSLLDEMLSDVCEECANPDDFRQAVIPLLTSIIEDPLNFPVLFCWHDASTGKALK